MPCQNVRLFKELQREKEISEKIKEKRPLTEEEYKIYAAAAKKYWDKDVRKK